MTKRRGFGVSFALGMAGVGESGHRAKVGGEVVLDATQRNGLRAAASGFACRRARVVPWPQLRPSVWVSYLPEELGRLKK
jgi:hypothetical protein